MGRLIEAEHFKFPFSGRFILKGALMLTSLLKTVQSLVKAIDNRMLTVMPHTN